MEFDPIHEQTNLDEQVAIFTAFPGWMSFEADSVDADSVEAESSHEVASETPTAEPEQMLTSFIIPPAPHGGATNMDAAATRAQII